ncbi:MAG TPA: S8 family serine peptidase, partial [Methylomirabilota bacterium]|nr:S8 family serine peptidase [Methylomirabilota bacterium]
MLPWVTGGATPPGAYVPGELVVKFRPGRVGLAPAAARHPVGAQLKTSLPVTGWEVVRLPAGLDVPAAVELYRGRPDVAYAEPNYRLRLFATPNDLRRPELWGLDQINAAGAWQYTTGSASVVVAVLDTGLDYTHPDLTANVWVNPGETPGNNLDDDQNGYTNDVHGLNLLDRSGDVRDDDGHGTHVAGTIGAVGHNGLGVVGVNWRVTLLPVKIFSADDSAGSAGAAEAYEYLMALKRRGVNIRVVNNSWGGPFPSAALAEAICEAERMGILTVCAAGNSHHDIDQRPEFPAVSDCPALIAVAAAVRDGQPAAFSNFGCETVHLAAPGEGVLSTYRGAGHYVTFSGTSMASPHVAGAAALLVAQDPTLTPLALKNLLLTTVTRAPAWEGRVMAGGILNVGAAMERLAAGNRPSFSASGPSWEAWPRLTALSRGPDGRWGNGESGDPSVSADGRFVAFLSSATNLVPGYIGSGRQVFLLDRQTGLMTWVSRPVGGASPDGTCSEVRISADGRVVAFVSTSSNLLPGASHESFSDVFVFDRVASQLEQVSRNANGDSDGVGVSGDGRYVIFSSAAHLVPGDNNGYPDVFLYDRQERAMTLVSVSSAEVQADFTSGLPAISADGRFATFLSGAANLVSDRYYPAYQLYLRDLVAGTTVRISRRSSSQPGNDHSGLSSLSADGRYIAFESRATNLVAGDVNGVQDIFLWDRVARVLKRVSVGNDGAPAETDCWAPQITGNGRHVFFMSDSSRFKLQDDSELFCLWGYDRLNGKLSRLSYNAAGLGALDNSFLPAASADGRLVVFESWAWNLVPGDGNGLRDVFALDRGTAIPDLIIYTSGETNRHGLGLHGSHIVQRRELALTNNGTAIFFIRVDNDSPTDEQFLVRASPAPPGWSAQFFRGTTNVTAAITGAGWPVAMAGGTNVTLRLEVASVDAAA